MDNRFQWSEQFCADHKPDTVEPLENGLVIERKDFEERDEGGWKYQERWVPVNLFLAEQALVQKETNDALMLGLVDLYELQIGEI